MQAIYEALSQADLFVAIGTSGHVYPAAGLVAQARLGEPDIEFNLEPSQQRSHFEQAIYGPAGETLPLWWISYWPIQPNGRVFLAVTPNGCRSGTYS